MTARELFGVILRTMGLWALYMAVDSMIWGLFRKYNVVRDANLMPTEDHMLVHQVFGLLYLAIAALLLCGTDIVVDMFYKPIRKPSPPDAADSPSASD